MEISLTPFDEAVLPKASYSLYILKVLLIFLTFKHELHSHLPRIIDTDPTVTILQLFRYSILIGKKEIK